MTLPTVKDIVNMYLYGQASTPENLLNTSLIRPAATAPLVIDINALEYMTGGPGRFAVGAQFDLVKDFFTADSSVFLSAGTVLANGDRVFSKVEAAALFGFGPNDFYGWNTQQYLWRDGTDDYAVRTFVYGSSSFKIGDNAQFVIAAAGNRYINNFSVIPNDAPPSGFPDNFDFSSDNLLTEILNLPLQEAVDPSGIGRTVNFHYTGTVAEATYTYNNFLSDGIQALTWDVEGAIPGLPNGDSLSKLQTDGVTLLNSLWDDGVTRFLDGNRPIIYGTDGNDTLGAGDADSIALSLASTQLIQNISDYKDNGVTFVGGPGSDVLTGGDAHDKLSGGTGNDTLTGGGGNDVLTGGADKDTFVFAAGAGADIIEDYKDSDGDRLRFTDKAQPADLSFSRSGNDLVLMAGAVTLTGFFTNNAADAHGLRYVDLELTGGFFRVPIGESGNRVDTDNPADLNDINPAGGAAGNEIIGTEFGDVLQGTDAADSIYGFGGNDNLSGEAGNDDLYGGSGNDNLYGGSGDDLIDTGDGLNLVQGGEGSDVIVGGIDKDTFYGDIANDGDGGLAGGDDLIFGGAGNDFISGQSGNDLIFGGAGDDTIYNGTGYNTVYGGSGNDNILVSSNYVAASTNLIYGEDGNDSLSVASVLSGSSVLDGGNGNDILRGSNTLNASAMSTFIGGIGDDTIYGSRNNDIYMFNTGDGEDTIFESGGSDILILGSGVIPENLVFSKISNDLHILIGSGVTIKSWFTSEEKQIDLIQFADGRTVSANEVQGILDNGGTIGAPSNHSPVAMADVFNAALQPSVSGNVLTNDSDPDGDVLAVLSQSFTTANGGAVVLLADGSLSYDAAASFIGSDSFSYTVHDGRGGQSSATVSISNIKGTPPDLPPTIDPAQSLVFAPLEQYTTPHEYAAGTPEFPVLHRWTRSPNGVDRDNLTLEQDHAVSVSFVSDGGVFRDTLGYYTIGADGVISNVQLLAEDLTGASRRYGRGPFHAGDLIADLGTLQAGTEIGFFMIANGYNINRSLFNKYDMEQGTLSFVTEPGRHAPDTVTTLADAGRNVELVFTDTAGRTHDLNGFIYHTASQTLNADGRVHTISGLNESGNLQIGFEDLYHGGDRDYNDVVIEVKISPDMHTIFPTITVATGLIVTDVDDNLIASATVALHGQSGDMLAFDNSLLAGTNIAATQSIDGGWSFTGEDTPDHYQSLLQSLTLSSTGTEAGMRQLDITITDHDGLTDNSTINVAIGNPGDTDAFAFLSDDLVFADGAVSAMADALTSGYTMEDGQGDDSLTLDISAILDHGDDVLALLGDAGDQLHVTGGTLTHQSDATVNGQTYALYAAASGLSVIVDADVIVSQAI